MRILWIALLMVTVMGCAMTWGKVSFVAGGAIYHREDPVQAASPTITQQEPEPDDEKPEPIFATRVTKLLRTWGTSTFEAVITPGSEKISLSSAGISSNMRAVVGDDVVAKGIKAGFEGSNPASGAGALAGKLAKYIGDRDKPGDDGNAPDLIDEDPDGEFPTDDGGGFFPQ